MKLFKKVSNFIDIMHHKIKMYFVRKRRRRKIGRITFGIRCDSKPAEEAVKKITKVVEKLSYVMNNLESQTEDTRYAIEHLNDAFNEFKLKDFDKECCKQTKK